VDVTSLHVEAIFLDIKTHKATSSAEVMVRAVSYYSYSPEIYGRKLLSICLPGLISVNYEDYELPGDIGSIIFVISCYGLLYMFRQEEENDVW
jgi:hypothetical protein